MWTEFSSSIICGRLIFIFILRNSIKRSFFTYLTTTNRMICISLGDFDAAKVQSSETKMFSSLPCFSISRANRFEGKHKPKIRTQVNIMYKQHNIFCQALCPFCGPKIAAGGLLNNPLHLLGPFLEGPQCNIS